MNWFEYGCLFFAAWILAMLGAFCSWACYDLRQHDDPKTMQELIVSDANKPLKWFFGFLAFTCFVGAIACVVYAILGKPLR
jgi:hypothetical protein